MRLLVCGDRNWSDADVIHRELYAVFFTKIASTEDMVVTGGAPGADTLAIQWAVENEVKTRTFMADWKKYGKAAGPIRNEQMLKFGVDRVLAFHADIDKSRGTKNMIKQATAAGVPIKVVDA